MVYNTAVLAYWASPAVIDAYSCMAAKAMAPVTIALGVDRSLLYAFLQHVIAITIALTLHALVSAFTFTFTYTATYIGR